MVSGFCQWVLIPVGFKTHWLNLKIKMIYLFNHFYLLIYLLFHFTIFYLFIILKKVQRGYPSNLWDKVFVKIQRGYPTKFGSKLVHTVPPWWSHDRRERVWITRPYMVWWFDRSCARRNSQTSKGEPLPYISASHPLTWVA